MTSLQQDPTKRNSLGEEPKQFANPQEEIAYLRLRLEECQVEFQEFQESSRELETEYETQIKQLETKNNESQGQIVKLESENDQLRSKYNIYLHETQHKLNEYQQQIAELTVMNDRLTNYIRELEQSNDDLERARRALAASLEDFEGQLNQQIERNVLLENEVSEKEELECVVQRLKEETRDLRHELIVNKNSSDPSKRKQILMDNQRPSLQIDTSLQSLDLNKSNSINSSNNNNNNSNQQSPECRASPSSASQNGDTKGRATPVQVDTTTSPMTPTRFSFSSPFSYNRSSSSKLSTDSKSQQTSTPASPTMPPMVMSASSRISALNIVSDLLRKVGALESKLGAAKRVNS